MLLKEHRHCLAYNLAHFAPPQDGTAAAAAAALGTGIEAQVSGQLPGWALQVESMGAQLAEERALQPGLSILGATGGQREPRG